MDNLSAADIPTERLRLVWMSPRFIELSLAGRIGEAGKTLGAGLPASWPDPDARRRLKMRLEQMQSKPEDAPWLLRGMVRRDGGEMVGVINFHGAPDERHRAELGYTVFEGHRRQGYATEAALGMMRWAATSHGAETFVVSISPENAASLGMAARLGFVQVGSQMDEEDALEWEFELSARNVGVP